MRSSLLWPLVIVLSTVAVGLVSFVMPGVVIRPLIVMGFLFICPGLALVCLLGINNIAVEVSLGVALSLALDAIVISLFMYARYWSPLGTLAILMWISFCCAILQLLLHFIRRSKISPA